MKALEAKDRAWFKLLRRERALELRYIIADPYASKAL